MSITLITPPAEEPLALADLKAFLRVETADEDSLIATLGRAARTHVEATLGLALVSQQWRITKDIWPKAGVLDLVFGPVAALTAVQVQRATGWESLPLTLFRLEGRRLPARISWIAGSVPEPHPTYGGITFDVTAGYGPAGAVPEPIRQAIRLLAAHWYEQRAIAVVGHEVARVPHGVEALLAPYRRRRLA